MFVLPLRCVRRRGGDRRPGGSAGTRCMVPVERIELPTFGLQNHCSTAELNRRNEPCFGERRNPWIPPILRPVEYQTCPQRARTPGCAGSPLCMKKDGLPPPFSPSLCLCLIDRGA